MAVKQFFLDPAPMAVSDGPDTAISVDDASGEVHVLFRESAGYSDEHKKSVTDNFVFKAQAWLGDEYDTSRFEDITDVMQYNLYSAIGDVTEYGTFEEADKAAQEAFGE